MNTRRVARELALLTLSQFETLPADARPSTGELLGRAADMLAREARESLETSCATLARMRDEIERLNEEEFGPLLVRDMVRAALKAQAHEEIDEKALEKTAMLFWKRAKEQDAMIELREGLLETALPRALTAIDELQHSAELIASALEWPTMAALAGAEDVRAFALSKVDHYIKHKQDVDATLERAAQHWKVERMASLDRDVLRLAVAELKYDPSVPVEVAINEAVELAKKYGTDESGRFVNGVLSAIAPEAAELRS